MQTPGVYAAERCAPEGLCDGQAVSTWGEATGPIAVDQQGNVFAIQTSPYTSGDQSLRGFEASTVAPGTGSTTGDELFTMAGYGSELAAASDAGASAGTVYFQPYDSTTYEALDVVAQRYTTGGSTVVPDGPYSTALTMVTANTPVALLTDEGGRLWVGIVTAAGQTSFFVLD